MKYEIRTRNYAEGGWVASVDAIDASGKVVFYWASDYFATIDACLHVVARLIAERERIA